MLLIPHHLLFTKKFKINHVKISEEEDENVDLNYAKNLINQKIKLFIKI